jgi:NH3-dependent NAD+ synthetase
MAAATYQQIKDSLRQLYADDPRLWLIGFSGGKDSTLVAALVFRHPLRLDRGEGRVGRCRNSMSFRTRHSALRIGRANRLRELQEQIAAGKGIRADALRRLLAKVDEFSESRLDANLSELHS